MSDFAAGPFSQKIVEIARKVTTQSNFSAEGAAYLQPMKSVEGSNLWTEAQKSSLIAVVLPQSPDTAGPNTRAVKWNVPLTKVPDGTYLTVPDLNNILADVVNDRDRNMKAVGLRPCGQAKPFGKDNPNSNPSTEIANSKETTNPVTPTGTPITSPSTDGKDGKFTVMPPMPNNTLGPMPGSTIPTNNILGNIVAKAFDTVADMIPLHGVPQSIKKIVKYAK